MVFQILISCLKLTPFSGDGNIDIVGDITEDDILGLKLTPFSGDGNFHCYTFHV